ncbi:fibrillin-3-like [Haliotis rufescens]|uniref:fibrillin-3-like n=1 Tax=Haliotis rufescens TaxID=6454 RepID=UPI00201F2E64|nr:fibrillin-3-like [Haliotis rufescens]
MLKIGLFLTSWLAVNAQGTSGSCMSSGCGDAGICIDYGSGNVRCSCTDGFQGTATQCVAESDCRFTGCTDGTCEAGRDGSYGCTCKAGFVLSQDDNKCVPAPENCPDTPCPKGYCRTNTDGSKVCVCTVVISSASGLIKCNSSASMTVDCTTRNCQYGVCINRNGVYGCQCLMGYTLSTTDRTVCVPVTQGQSSTNAINVCQWTVCTNGRCGTDVSGAPRCICDPGYQLSPASSSVCVKIYKPVQWGCDVSGCLNGYCAREYNGRRKCICYPGFRPHPHYPSRCVEMYNPWRYSFDIFSSPMGLLLLGDF